MLSKTLEKLQEAYKEITDAYADDEIAPRGYTETQIKLQEVIRWVEVMATPDVTDETIKISVTTPEVDSGTTTADVKEE